MIDQINCGKIIKTIGVAPLENYCKLYDKQHMTCWDDVIENPNMGDLRKSQTFDIENPNMGDLPCFEKESKSPTFSIENPNMGDLPCFKKDGKFF